MHSDACSEAGAAGQPPWIAHVDPPADPLRGRGWGRGYNFSGSHTHIQPPTSNLRLGGCLLLLRQASVRGLRVPAWGPASTCLGPVSSSFRWGQRLFAVIRRHRILPLTPSRTTLNAFNTSEQRWALQVALWGSASTSSGPCQPLIGRPVVLSTYSSSLSSGNDCIRGTMGG